MDNISLLNLGGKFPKEIITVVIFKSDRPKFEKEPVELYQNKRICVTGKVTLYKDKLRLVVNDPKQIMVGLSVSKPSAGGSPFHEASSSACLGISNQQIYFSYRTNTESSMPA